MSTTTETTGNGNRVRKSMSIEERDKLADNIAAAFKAGDLKDGSIRITQIIEEGNCDKIIAMNVAMRAMDKVQAYIKIIDDKPSTSVPNPHVNAQNSLIISAKTMQGIVNDKKEMIFPVGTQFSMEHDADTIILTKIA